MVSLVATMVVYDKTEELQNLIVETKAFHTPDTDMMHLSQCLFDKNNKVISTSHIDLTTKEFAAIITEISKRQVLDYLKNYKLE